MSSPDAALATQIANIGKRTGKSLGDLFALLTATGLEKHGALRDHLKSALGLGHGDANTVVTLFREQARGTVADARGATAAGGADAAHAFYAGGKEHLRPIHDAVMAAIGAFGPFEIAPKKAYLSLRRKKQFAMVGPATRTRVEVGLNMKGVAPTARLLALPPGGMCQYKVQLTATVEVDDELVAWVRTAYDAAG